MPRPGGYYDRIGFALPGASVSIAPFGPAAPVVLTPGANVSIASVTIPINEDGVYLFGVLGSLAIVFGASAPGSLQTFPSVDGVNGVQQTTISPALLVGLATVSLPIAAMIITAPLVAGSHTVALFGRTTGGGSSSTVQVNTAGLWVVSWDLQD